MRMASREDDVGYVARAGAVRRECIAHDHAPVLADEPLEGLRALVTANAMHDRTGRRETPHLPWLGTSTVEPRPAGLVEPDHRLLHHMLDETSDRDLQSLRDAVELIPQRLWRDDQAVLRHDPRLARERKMVEVLVDDDLDRDVERVAPAVDRALGGGAAAGSSEVFAPRGSFASCCPASAPCCCVSLSISASVCWSSSLLPLSAASSVHLRVSAATSCSIWTCCASAMRRRCSMSCSRSSSCACTLSTDHISRSVTRGFATTASGDSACRPTSVLPSMYSASSLAVRRAAVASSRHSDANRPRASRF